MRTLLGLPSSPSISPAAASATAPCAVTSSAATPGVATVGFFDGMHAGHRRVLADLKAWAREVGGPPAVVTFERHPLEVLAGMAPPKINSLAHRLLLLARAGIETAAVISFDPAVAAWTAEEFIERVVKGALGCTGLFMGFDSAFGRGRAGTFEFLKAREAHLGVHVRRGEPLAVDGQRV